jgi:hypothetical protein
VSLFVPTRRYLSSCSHFDPIDVVVPIDIAGWTWNWADIQANLALTSQRYTEEHERCTRYETLWRDAQDREAKGQFEIAQLLDEISQLRAKR